jgi:hypothetical protein
MIPHRVRRLGKIVMWTLLAVEVIYLPVGNFALRSEKVIGLINRKPERFSITWSSGTTFAPGWVRLEGVRVTGQSSKVQYQVAFDRGSFVVNPLMLAFRSAVIHSASVEGLTVLLRKRLDAYDLKKEGAAGFPPIEGLANPPERKPELLYPKKTKASAPWSVSVSGASFSAVRDIWLSRFRLRGEMEMRVSMSLRIKDSLEIGSVDFHMEQGRMTLGQGVLAENLDLDVNASLDRFAFAEVKGKAVLGMFSGSVHFDGDLGNLDFVRQYGAEDAGISFEGKGTSKADLKIRRGAFLPGSTIHIAGNPLTVGILDYSFDSSGTVDSEVIDREGTCQSSTTIELGPLTGRREAHETKTLSGEGMKIVMAADGPSLTGRKALHSLDFELPVVKVPDVTIFNDLLPDVAGLKLIAGKAGTTAEYHIDPEGKVTGGLRFVALETSIGVEERTFSGDVELSTHITGGTRGQRKLDLGETYLTLKNFVLPGKQKEDDEGWWMEIQIPSATLDLLGADRHIAADVDLSMRDTDPFIHMMEGGKKASRWLKLVPNIKGLKGGLGLSMQPDLLALDAMDITGEGTEVLGNLHITREGKDGLIYAKWKIFSVAMEYRGKEKEMKLVGSRKWFMKKVAERGLLLKREPGEDAPDTPEEELTPYKLDRKEARKAGGSGASSR